MLPAVFDVTQVDIANGRYTLRAAGKVMKSPGFLAVYGVTRSGGAAPRRRTTTTRNRRRTRSCRRSPRARASSSWSCEKEQKFTQPPAQFSEATLVKALEENGIGRPSTYATILVDAAERDYAEKIEGRFRPTALGKLVNGLLQQGFNDIINEGYTADLEERARRDRGGHARLEEGARPTSTRSSPRTCKAAGKELPNVKNEGVPTGGDLPAVRLAAGAALRPLRLVPGVHQLSGVHLHPRSRDGAATTSAGGGRGRESPPCELCGKPMALKRSRFGTFLGCTGYPECKNIRKTGPAAAPPKPTGVACPGVRPKAA